MTDIYPLNQISSDPPPRFKTGIEGLDKVLGGGLVKGANILVAGTPGSGKSTLLIQLAYQLSAGENKRVLYVAGEENKEQLKMRAVRLGIDSGKILLMEDTEVEHIIEAKTDLAPDLVIIDSLQTLFSKSLRTTPGSSSQIKNGLLTLCALAKKTGTTFVFIGHSTKGGFIAGLLTLQHMVDVTLYLGVNDDDTRFLRANKNRFGTIDFIWQTYMTEYGLANDLSAVQPDGYSKTITLTNSEIENLIEGHAIWGPIVSASIDWLKRQAESR